MSILRLCQRLQRELRAALVEKARGARRAVDSRRTGLALGLAAVDPQPLTQITGEGIAPDATEAAHEEVSDQLAKLARPEDNVL